MKYFLAILCFFLGSAATLYFSDYNRKDIPKPHNISELLNFLKLGNTEENILKTLETNVPKALIVKKTYYNISVRDNIIDLNRPVINKKQEETKQKNITYSVSFPIDAGSFSCNPPIMSIEL